MTAQATENLIYKNKKLSMATEPLRDYLWEHHPDLDFGMLSTACWRGYIGTWEVTDGKLYLTELSYGKYSIVDIFPNGPPVFAEWYSGTIRVPIGEQLLYVHMEYGSLYEKDVFIEVESGVVVSEKEVDNSEEYESLPENVKAGWDDIPF